MTSMRKAKKRLKRRIWGVWFIFDELVDYPTRSPIIHNGRKF